MAKEERPVYVQYWHKHQPTLGDALRVVYLSLELLAEALPLAMKQIGSETAEDQMAFWETFIAFRGETDCDDCGRMNGMSEKLREMALWPRENAKPHI